MTVGKIMMKAYLWILYILAAPLVLVSSIVLLTWMSICNIRDFGKPKVKDTVGAYVAGLKDGHRINMYTINSLDKDGYVKEES